MNSSINPFPIDVEDTSCVKVKGLEDEVAVKYATLPNVVTRLYKELVISANRAKIVFPATLVGVVPPSPRLL